jgi:hypothetical protein
MALEIYDFHQNYTRRGDLRQLFNVARSDETLGELRYYAYLNDSGAYIIQRVTTSGTLDVKVYEYYGAKSSDLATDWSGRASLPYGEYNELFKA